MRGLPTGFVSTNVQPALAFVLPSRPYLGGAPAGIADCARGAVMGFASSYETAMISSPLLTAVTTAASLAVIGDCMSQRHATPGTYSWRRGSAFAVFGALYTGCFLSYSFAFLIQHLGGSYLASALAFGKVTGVSSLQYFAAAERTLANQLIMVPCVYYPLFFLVTGLAYNLSWREIVQRARKLYLPLQRRNLLFWIPVQMFQFSFVRPALQIPYVCLAGLVWNFVLSSMTVKSDGATKL